MKTALPTDLDYLAARIHGRRSRLIEGAQLDTLCRLRTLADLLKTLVPGGDFRTITELQRHLIRKASEEIADAARQVPGAAGRLISWLAVRYQVENLKVLARGFATRRPVGELERYLVPVDTEFALDARALASAGSPEAFAALVPSRPLRKNVEAVLDAYRALPRAFFLEAAMDRGYLAELLVRSSALSGDPAEDVMALLRHETALFHLMLVTRGRFLYGLPETTLRPMAIPGGAISRETFQRMLAAPDLPAAMTRLSPKVLGGPPPAARTEEDGTPTLDVSVLEAMGWNRYLLLANRAFRRDHMGLGAVVAYAAIRRVELGNLITLSEGIRTGTAPDVLRARLTPREDLEAARV